MKYEFDKLFPRYDSFNPKVPVWCVTPEIDGAFHRFFDTSPVSPSGRFMALTQMPDEHHMPEPGSKANIILVDLKEGTNRIISETYGWDTQLGAQAQWGKDDSQLFYNDMDPGTWDVFGVVYNPLTGEKRKLDGTTYMISPDGQYALSPCLRRIGITQPGYGVIIPPEEVPLNYGAPDDDGIYITDVSTGKMKLLVSIKEIVKKVFNETESSRYGSSGYYGFHVKWNLQGNRIMFVLRYKEENKKYIPSLITMNSDGKDIQVAIPASVWGKKGGHHPNWFPDGVNVLMNINMHGDGMKFVKAKYDGSDFGILIENIAGSGHPTVHPNGRIIVTDAYLHEPVAFEDGTVPIRMIDLDKEQEENLIRIGTKPVFSGLKGELRVDPHPAWDYTYRYIVFNACPEGVRKVYIADLREYLE